MTRIPPINDPKIINNIPKINSTIALYGMGSSGLKQEKRIAREIINAITELTHPSPNHPPVISGLPTRDMIASINPIKPPIMIKIFAISLLVNLILLFIVCWKKNMNTDL